MPLGVYVLIVAVVFALAFGIYRALTDGSFRGTRKVRGSTTEPGEDTGTSGGSVLDGTRWEAELGERATLLQFSSAFCAPCRATRRILIDVAALVPGVTHIEVDAEQHLDLVRRLGVMRTPTTLILDPRGSEVSRAAGAPVKDQVLAALGAAESK
jgi:thiol-disulfide isomerase/thioredoxin